MATDANAKNDDKMVVLNSSSSSSSNFRDNGSGAATPGPSTNNQGKGSDIDNGAPPRPQRPSTPEELRRKFELIQQQLALTFHAQRCRLPIGACLLPHCDTMKRVLQHLVSCKNTDHTPKCSFQYCYSTRSILAHWHGCEGKCRVCLPVKHLLLASDSGTLTPSKRPAESQQPGNGSGSSAAKRFHPGAPLLPPSAQRPQLPMHQFIVKVWDLVVEWGKIDGAGSGGQNSQSGNGNGNEGPKTYSKISMPCQVFTHNAATAAELHAAHAPSRLSMKLIPTSIVNKLGFMQNVKPFRFQFNNKDQKRGLVESLKGGQYCGYVHMECAGGGSAGAGSSFKLLMLYYNSKTDIFMGYMPMHQKDFVDKLKAVVEQQRDHHRGLGQSKTS